MDRISMESKGTLITQQKYYRFICLDDDDDDDDSSVRSFTFFFLFFSFRLCTPGLTAFTFRFFSFFLSFSFFIFAKRVRIYAWLGKTSQFRGGIKICFKFPVIVEKFVIKYSLLRIRLTR